MAERKLLFFPRWVEAIVVVALLVMCVVEWLHWQVFWSLLFGAAALCFGVSLAARMFKGDHNEPT